MKAKLRKHLLLISLFYLIVSILAFESLFSLSLGQDQVDRARQEVVEAFAMVLEAEKAGGNVTRLISSLNEALGLIAKGENYSDATATDQIYIEAVDIASNVRKSAPEVRESGLIGQRNFNITLAFGLAAIGMLGVLIYLYLPRLFWGLWLRGHGDWRLRAR